MAIVKNILRHVTIETAERRRRCHHKGTHTITKGMACLVVVDERGSKTNYCPACAKPMLEMAASNLREFAISLGLSEHAVSRTRADLTPPATL